MSSVWLPSHDPSTNSSGPEVRRANKVTALWLRGVAIGETKCVRCRATRRCYTGTAIVDGGDTVRELIEPMCRSRGARFEDEELDPDVFGEQLEARGYEQVERIAAVGLKVVVR